MSTTAGHATKQAMGRRGQVRHVQPFPPVRVLVTGGAGFIGSSIALALVSRHQDWSVVACDNLYRRGSELNLPRLREAGVEFRHADVRIAEDLMRIDHIDAVVECSAEPSAMAGVGGGARYLVETNLVGAFNCLELVAREHAQLIFLSTSRVYPVAAQARLSVRESETRYELTDSQPLPGVSSIGLTEDFPLEGARTLYGSTKLAAELLIAEYAQTHGLRTVIDRCGVVAGPWQLGHAEQGVFSFWMISAYFGRTLRYMGFGGSGKQVRDLLHVADLVDLVERQLLDPDGWSGTTFNVGGGRAGSLSLLEASALCEKITGSRLEVGSSTTERPGDVRVYLSDCRRLFEHTDWRPQRSPEEILVDIFGWIHDHESLVASLSQGGQWQRS